MLGDGKGCEQIKLKCDGNWLNGGVPCCVGDVRQYS